MRNKLRLQPNNRDMSTLNKRLGNIYPHCIIAVGQSRQHSHNYWDRFRRNTPK